ncbi:unnamed protein product [Symbiodinium sp. CCMP2592]|nr:unnamed protein product [Symbiodinium sp. CCMP2592]
MSAWVVSLVPQLKSGALVQAGHQPAVVDGAEIATRGAPDELEADNSIEAILARSRRKELVARAGPGAVRYLPSEDPNAAHSVFVPALRDLEGLLRKAEIPVSIAALDLTASPVPPDAFLWEYPAAVAPHIQLILPRSMDGEAGVVDFDGVWDAQSLAMAACRLAGPRAPEISAEEISRLENGIQKLRDLMFEMLFLQEVPLQDVGRKAGLREESFAH